MDAAMTSLRIQNTCQHASLELNETLNAFDATTDQNNKPALTACLMSQFLITMCCLVDVVRFELLMDSIENELSVVERI